MSVSSLTEYTKKVHSSCELESLKSCQSDFKVVMKLVILLGIFFHQIITSVCQNDTQCIENPTGEVSLNVAVRGVPGPEGPRGPKGDIGLRGRKGLKGDRGVPGEKGDHGEIGPSGRKGTKGDEGRKGQKGVHGPQGKHGPPGSPGLVSPRGSRGPPGHEGHEGPEGPIGLPGPAGRPGPIGLQGEPGDTVLNDEELDRVISSLHNSILGNVSTTVSQAIYTVMSELKAMNETLKILNSNSTLLSVEYLPTGQGLPILILQRVASVQQVFVPSQILAPGKQHVEGLFPRAVHHSNSHPMVPTLMCVVE